MARRSGEHTLADMMRLWMIVAVAFGGAAGALLRWGIAAAVQRQYGVGGFPIGTMTVNVIGCFALGVGYVMLVERTTNPALRMGLTVGLLGALTTFSTYCVESFILIDEQQRYLAAAGNLLGSVVAGMVAVVVGVALARYLVGG